MQKRRKPPLRTVQRHDELQEPGLRYSCECEDGICNPITGECNRMSSMPLGLLQLLAYHKKDPMWDSRSREELFSRLTSRDDPESRNPWRKYYFEPRKHETISKVKFEQDVESTCDYGFLSDAFKQKLGREPETTQYPAKMLQSILDSTEKAMENRYLEYLGDLHEHQFGQKPNKNQTIDKRISAILEAAERRAKDACDSELGARQKQIQKLQADFASMQKFEKEAMTVCDHGFLDAQYQKQFGVEPDKDQDRNQVLQEILEDAKIKAADASYWKELYETTTGEAWHQQQDLDALESGEIRSKLEEWFVKQSSEAWSRLAEQRKDAQKSIRGLENLVSKRFKELFPEDETKKSVPIMTSKIMEWQHALKSKLEVSYNQIRMADQKLYGQLPDLETLAQMGTAGTRPGLVRVAQTLARDLGNVLSWRFQELTGLEFVSIADNSSLEVWDAMFKLVNTLSWKVDLLTRVSALYYLIFGPEKYSDVATRIPNTSERYIHMMAEMTEGLTYPMDIHSLDVEDILRVVAQDWMLKKIGKSQSLGPTAFSVTKSVRETPRSDWQAQLKALSDAIQKEENEFQTLRSRKAKEWESRFKQYLGKDIIVDPNQSFVKLENRYNAELVRLDQDYRELYLLALASDAPVETVKSLFPVIQAGTTPFNEINLKGKSDMLTEIQKTVRNKEAKAREPAQEGRTFVNNGNRNQPKETEVVVSGVSGEYVDEIWKELRTKEGLSDKKLMSEIDPLWIQQYATYRQIRDACKNECRDNESRIRFAADRIHEMWETQVREFNAIKKAYPGFVKNMEDASRNEPPYVVRRTTILADRSLSSLSDSDSEQWSKLFDEQKSEQMVQGFKQLYPGVRNANLQRAIIYAKKAMSNPPTAENGSEEDDSNTDE